MKDASFKCGIGWLFVLPVLLLSLTNLIMAAVTGASVLEPYTTSSSLFPSLSAAVVFVLGAVAEELLYRWFLLKKMFFQTTKQKTVLSVLIVSVLFASMHLRNLQASVVIQKVILQVFSAFCFSIWAGAVVWRTDRIWILLFAHVFLNATAGNTEIT